MVILSDFLKIRFYLERMVFSAVSQAVNAVTPIAKPKVQRSQWVA